MPPTTHELWHELHDALHGFLRRRVNDPDAADDLLQDVFLRIHRGLPALDDAQRVVPWVYRIARNAVTDYYRRAKRPSSGLDEHATASTPAEAEDETDPRIAACLRAMLDNLPEPYRRAVRAVDLDGQPQTAFAEANRLAPTTARSRVQRGRKKLKERLLSCCAYEFDRRGHPLGPLADRCENPGCGCADTAS